MPWASRLWRPAPRAHLTSPPLFNPCVVQRVVTELGEAIPDEELREMIEEADRDADGFVVFDDFYRCAVGIFFA